MQCVADYQGDPLASALKFASLNPLAVSMSCPWERSSDGRNRIDTHSRLAAFDGGARLALPGMMKRMRSLPGKAFRPRCISWRWTAPASTTWWSTRLPDC